MKIAKIISLLALIVAVFFSIDLGINFAYSLVPELNDGLGNWCVVNIFGDDYWSGTAYLSAFQKSVWLTFAVFIENAVLAVISERKR